MIVSVAVSVLQIFYRFFRANEIADYFFFLFFRSVLFRSFFFIPLDKTRDSVSLRFFVRSKMNRHRIHFFFKIAVRSRVHDKQLVWSGIVSKIRYKRPQTVAKIYGCAQFFSRRKYQS